MPVLGLFGLWGAGLWGFYTNGRSLRSLFFDSSAALFLFLFSLRRKDFWHSQGETIDETMPKKVPVPILGSLL